MPEAPEWPARTVVDGGGAVPRLEKAATMIKINLLTVEQQRAKKKRGLDPGRSDRGGSLLLARRDVSAGVTEPR